MDRVNTFGTAFLGLTVSCAQCHDHKFDPLPQRDYYRLYAFFNQSVDDGHGKSQPGGTLAFPGEISGSQADKAAADEARLDLEAFLDARGGDYNRWRESLHPETRAQLSAAMRAALELPWAEQTLAQRRSIYGYFVRDDPDFQQRVEKLNALERQEGKVVTTLIMADAPEPRPTTLFIKGDFTRPGEPVTPGTPAILPPLERRTPQPTRPRPLALRPRPPADRPRHGQPDLAADTSAAAWSRRKTISAPRVRRRPTPSCSTGSPPSSSPRHGA
jgi:hypothetical protein